MHTFKLSTMQHAFTAMHIPIFRSVRIHAAMLPLANCRRGQNVTPAPAVEQTVSLRLMVLNVGGPITSVTYQSTALEILLAVQRMSTCKMGIRAAMTLSASLVSA